MKLYGVEIVETVVKRVVVDAEDTNDAMHIAADMDTEEFDYTEVLEAKCTVYPFDNEDDDEDESLDFCDEFDDCDDCPDHCEVCDSCAREADFVAKRGKCADCPARCPACGACTFDE